MKQKLLILNKDPFGYHIDTYKYCEYLRDRFEIIYICIEPINIRIEPFENIKVVYITNRFPRLIRGIYYTFYCLIFTLFFKGKIFVKYFETSILIKRLLFWKKMILDVRTLSVSPNESLRYRYNKKLMETCKYFDHITVISPGIRDKLKIPIHKTSILPLGADIISTSNKSFSDIKLLYIGTLFHRRLEDTILGFKLFCNKYPNNGFTYDIIGSGYNKEQDILTKLIEQLDLADKIKLHGFIPSSLVKPFFDKCNIGVSYIPITDFYNFQPPTKTFEYIMSGLFTIGTSTFSNREIINSSSGILIEDNADSFSNALEFIYFHRQFDSRLIRETLLSYSWESIINKCLIPILDII